MLKFENKFLDRIMILSLNGTIKWELEKLKNRNRYRGIGNSHIFVISEHHTSDNYICFTQKNIFTVDTVIENWEQIKIDNNTIDLFIDEIKNIIKIKIKNIIEYKNYFINKETGEILYG
jgi:hypothetical protein